jgi:hypothetical protein
MGQTLDMLLNADPAKVKNIPTGKIEISRLTKALGQPFYISFRAATLDELKEIGENSNGKDTEEMKWTLYELCSDPNFKSKELREKYGIVRPVDIVQNILLGGEILTVYAAIMRLSGTDKNAGVDIGELKN